MRLVFTGYAINAATVSLVLTTALMICDEWDESFVALGGYVLFYMRIVFGPALLLFCGYGFANIRNLSNKCTLEQMDQTAEGMNTFDVGVLFLAAMLAVMVTCSYGLTLTAELAESELNREGSVFF